MWPHMGVIPFYSTKPLTPTLYKKDMKLLKRHVMPRIFFLNHLAYYGYRNIGYNIPTP